jgi:hypothetical protein
MVSNERRVRSLTHLLCKTRARGKNVAFALILCATLGWSQEDRILNYALVGSASCKGGPCWSAIDRLEVQRALLAAAKTPQTASELTSLLGNSGTTLADLEALRLVRRQGDRYSIAFALFPADDVQRSRALAEVHARSLADSLLTRRSEIEASLRVYSAPGVDLKDVAFIVLGCFSLDWDGLKITKAKGYRTETGAARPDGYYVPWAEERIDVPYRSFCYSSFIYQGDAGAVTFSDGTSDDRFLVDAWRNESRAVALGRMLLAMRDGKATLAGLARAAKIPASDARQMLAELTERQYVRIAGDSYTVNFPVLSQQDKQMVVRLRKIGREVIESWLAANYLKLESDLAGIAPTRAGVPYAESFNWIWHDVFGRANVMLVEAGLFADPYAEGRTWRRYTPAVYLRALTK